MNNKKKMLSKRIVAGIMSALVLVSNTGISAFAAEQSRAVPNESGYVSIADPSTMDVWKNYFSTGNDATNQKLLSTEFAGGVWTDKSVFTAADAANSTELPSGAKSIGSDNFLVALSAIASNKEIVGYSTIPTDTVLVLDVSQSMDSANSVPDMVSAANSAISRLLELNKNNRVGVVLYSGNHAFGNSETSSGTELLALGRYTANANKQYLTYSSYRYNNSDPNGTRITTATGLKTESGQNVTQTAKTTQGGTYIQNGLYKAWQMFEKVTDTVVTTSSGNNVQEGTQRMPIMVLMSDGAPTAGTTSYQSIGTSNQGNGGDSSSGLGFLTQLTAAWVRQKIEKKYNNTAMKFYTLGLDLSRDSDTTKHDVAASVLDPENSMSAVDADWTDFLGDGSASITVPNLYNYGGDTRNITVSLANDGITFDASSQNYVDRYFEADSNEELNAAFGDIVKEIIVQSAYYPTLVTEGNHNLDGYVTFEDVLGQFMEVKEIKGLMLGDTLFTGEVLAKMMVSGEFGNAAKYTDTGWELVETVSERIGVEETQAITLLQEAWKSKQLYWESDTAYSNYIGWYEKADGSFVAHWADTHTAAEEAAEVAKGAKYITKSYGFYGATGASSSIQGTNMMHVVIKVRTDIATGHQDVIYQIPAALIPTITYSITLNADSLEEATEISLTVNEEEPLRLLFEVGLREGLNAINIKEYMANLKSGQHAHAVEDTKHADYGKYYFYSNQWGDGTQFEDADYEDDDFDYTTPHAHQTAESHFHPSLDNERYYYTENTTIYVKDGENYRPYTSSATAPSATGTYYRQRIVFRLKTATGTAAEMVTLYEQISEATLQKEDHLDQNADNSWYVKKGTVHQIKARELEAKTENTTKTLKYSDYPVIDHAENSTDTYDIYSYLGNNGRLTVTPATGIALTKQVDDTLVNANENYTFEITINANQSSYDAVLTKDGTQSQLTFHDGKAQVVLKAGESVYITDLPIGAYSVEEIVEKDADYKVKSVTVNGTAEAGTVASDSLVAMTMHEVVFVNTEAKEGNLVIGKTVTHNFGSDYVIPTNVKFDVEVILKDADDNPLENQKFATSVGDKTTDSNGKISGLTIGHNETISINGLPASTQYEVQEILGAKDAYFDQTNTNLRGTIEEDATSTVVLTNAYTPTQYAPTNMSINVTKSVVDENQATKNWGGKSFTFALQILENGNWVSVKNGNSNVEGTASEAAKNFSLQIPKDFFKVAGIYYFRVLETNVDNEDNIMSDTARYFTVYVTDKDMDGALEIDKTEVYSNGVVATIAGEQNIDMDFINQYVDSGLVVDIPIKKVLKNETGANIPLNGFEFRLYDEHDIYINKNAFSDAHGDAMIRMAYTASGLGLDNHGDQITVNYTLREVNDGRKGISYQTEGIPIAITLKNDSGELKLDSLSINGDSKVDATATVTNTYSFTANHKISGTKHLDNRTNKAIQDNEFQFTLYETDADFDIQGHTPESVKNTGSAFSWGRSYTKIGSYYYVIVEGQTTSPGVTTDKAEHHVTVTVTTNENGEPVVTQSVLRLGTTTSNANEDIFFRNTYKAAPVSEVIQGTKNLLTNKVSKDLEHGMFTFTLSENGQVIDTAENTAFTGAFAFDQITYTEVGTHVYTVKEVIPDVADREPGVVYDNSEYTVTITITDEGNGQLQASKHIQKVGETGTSAAITFENKYEPKAKTDLVIEAEKIMKNRALKDGEFTFNLYEANANFTLKTGQVLFSAKNDADGKVAFDFATAQIAFDTVDTFYYLIAEDIPTGTNVDENVAYDYTVYQVTVMTFDRGGEISAHVSYAVNGREIEAEEVDFVNYHFDKVEKDVFEKGKTNVSIDGKTVKAGDVLTYEISYENTSSDKRQDVIITDVLPEGVTYVEGSATQKGLVVYTASTRELKWVIGNVEAKEKITVSFDVTVNEDAQEVENTGLVQIGDNLYSTNSVTIYTYDKDVDKTKALVGEELTYTIEYRNNEATKANVVVVDKLAEGLTYVEGSATNGGVYDSQTHTITWTIADVEAGKGGKLSFKAVINEKAVKVVENVATIQVGNGPEVKTDTTSTEILLPPPIEKPAQTEAPKTGDSTSAAMWSTLAFASIMVCGAILVIEKKRKGEI